MSASVSESVIAESELARRFRIQWIPKLLVDFDYLDRLVLELFDQIECHCLLLRIGFLGSLQRTLFLSLHLLRVDFERDSEFVWLGSLALMSKMQAW